MRVPHSFSTVVLIVFVYTPKSPWGNSLGEGGGGAKGQTSERESSLQEAQAQHDTGGLACDCPQPLPSPLCSWTICIPETGHARAATTPLHTQSSCLGCLALLPSNSFSSFKSRIKRFHSHSWQVPTTPWTFLHCGPDHAVDSRAGSPG